MKTLRESLLSGQNKTIQAGDDYNNKIQNEFEFVKKICLDPKEYDVIKHSKDNTEYRIRLEGIYALNEYLNLSNAHFFSIIIGKNTFTNNKWTLAITFYGDYRCREYIQGRMNICSESECKSLKSAIKKITPIFDSIETFKEFIINNKV
jgi:hypothetical protein